MRGDNVTDQWSQPPSYEGHPVEGVMIKMSGSMLAEGMEDVVVGIDDIVQVVSQFRCVGVHHDVEKSTGKLIRVQILRPIEAALAPFDPSNPEDRGILHSPVTQVSS
jgi:hypothetical protein